MTAACLFCQPFAARMTEDPCMASGSPLNGQELLSMLLMTMARHTIVVSMIRMIMIMAIHDHDGSKEKYQSDDYNHDDKNITTTATV